MGRERRDQNPQPDKQPAEVTSTARVFALVEPEESATISYEELVMRGCPIVIDQRSVEAVADKMLRQLLHLHRVDGQSKTTHEKPRKSPWMHKVNEVRLGKKYRRPNPLEPDQALFVVSSRIIDPPPPSHDVGDFGIHELAELSLDPEVLDIFAKSQSNSGTLVCPDQLEGGFSIIDLAMQTEDTEAIEQVNPYIFSSLEEDDLPNEDDYSENSRA